MRTRKPSAQYCAQLLGAMFNQMSLAVAGGQRRTLDEVLAARNPEPPVEPQAETQPQLQVKV